MEMRNPHRYQNIAIIEPNEARAYRLKARLLGQGYRQVEVFLSRESFQEAVDQGYVPDHVTTGAAAGVPARQ